MASLYPDNLFPVKNGCTRLVVALLLLMLAPVSAAQQVPDPEMMSRWVQDMKTDAKGPFERIMWFCNDGEILPPKPYACTSHGGGIQHGELNDRARAIREAGYYVANVLAEFDPPDITVAVEGRERLQQILLERYLIAIDGGWIFRRVGQYRGALQIEDEIAGARRILLALSGPPFAGQSDFLLRRDATRLLPDGLDLPSLTDVRQRSTELVEGDQGFEPLRNKIHGQPDAMDAERVRAYALGRPADVRTMDYERLAMAIDQLYLPGNISDQLSLLADRVKSQLVASRLRMGAEALAAHLDPETRFDVSSELLAFIRNSVAEAGDAERQLALLDVGSSLELEVFRAGTALVARVPRVSRTRGLLWLNMSSAALYGSGMISERQWLAIQASIRRLIKREVSLAEYREELRYLSRMPSWASRWQQFHYGAAIEHLAAIEPLVRNFLAEQLRSSPLVIYSNILDTLLRDANTLARIPHQLFGETAGVGLRKLNPGLTRGILRQSPPGRAGLGLERDGVYLLPATTAELSPVAGILTLGEGNALSHVQILANNLGIPNVAVDHSLLIPIQQKLNRPVVLAASPGGRVLIADDGPQWDEVFGGKDAVIADRIKPNLEKLDLNVTALLRLEQLGAADSGRLAGPKAANLGELKWAFPGRVPPGIVVPFGVFRQLLEQEMVPAGKTVFEWMRQQYRAIDQLAGQPEAQDRARQAFLARLTNWIINADPGEAFRTELRRVLEQTFGADGSYALFVRSDTNIEDLPGFSGAGLNLTVPNVVGFENVLMAISQIWASPFGERASAWRQERMEQPEHVYVSVLLMPSVPVEKSGVMMTVDVETGRRDRYSVAVNEGIGGAVAGQSAEELRLDSQTGAVRLLAEATAPTKRVLSQQGGLQLVPVSNREQVLEPNEIAQLLTLAEALPTRFPQRDDQGQLAPADVEFGFFQGGLVLFQIRPYVGSRRALKNSYLNRMDAGLEQMDRRVVQMHAMPGNQVR